MSRVHKVFISYHHELDESRRNIFELRFGNSHGVILPAAVSIGDIDPDLSTDDPAEDARRAPS